jgi:HAD superfamily hydrolase (TIGR01490 family)
MDSNAMYAPVGVAGRDIASSRLVLVDVDRTLLPGSSLVPLVRVLVAARVVSRRTLLRALVGGFVFARAGATDEQVERVKSRALAVVTGSEVAELTEFASEVAADLAKHLRPSMRTRIEAHLAAGDFVVLLSAAPQPLVDALAGHLGVHRAVGTRAASSNGIYTGELSGDFCYGIGKLSRLFEVIGPADLSNAIAYADSCSDLPVLAAVGEPVAVQPDRRLRSIARQRGWSVLLG